MELNEKEFIAGFNSGYLIAEYEPLILTALLKQIHPINSYIYGMSLGQKEYELEVSKIQLNELGQMRQKTSREKNRFKDL